MARPLRIDVEGGWYHVMSRGIERRTIFLDESYCIHFLCLLGQMSERYGVEVHGYVLMGNHYHLLLHTTLANASDAMQWLNVSFSAWFNAKRQRVGHVFQGRFRATLIDGHGAWLLDMSAYIHLNPVRVSKLGLGKSANRAEAKGLVGPDREQVAERLKVLREHRWSSYMAYGNYGRGPEWLRTEEILKRAGDAAAYRQHVQQFITRGLEPEEFDGLKERVAIGSQAFLAKAKSLVKSVSKEQPDRSFLATRTPFHRIVAIVEAEKGERWADFHGRYGDWGTALVLYLARLRTGQTLREIGDAAGGMDYKNVSTCVRRFERKLTSDRSLKAIVGRCLERLTTDET